MSQEEVKPDLATIVAGIANQLSFRVNFSAEELCRNASSVGLTFHS